MPGDVIEIVEASAMKYVLSSFAAMLRISDIGTGFLATNCRIRINSAPVHQI